MNEMLQLQQIMENGHKRLCLLRNSLVGKSVSNTGWRVDSFLQLCEKAPIYYDNKRMKHMEKDLFLQKHGEYFLDIITASMIFTTSDG